MRPDPTEDTRRSLVSDACDNPMSREALEAQYGKVWDTAELSADFKVTGFLAPFCAVERKADGKTGTVMFQHSPRFYYGFEEGHV